MDTFIKILPVIAIIVLIFIVRECLSLFRYMKHCKLHEAARKGIIDDVGRLLKEGHPLNLLDPRFGLTPLHYAVRNGHVDVAKLLIEHGAGLEDMSAQGITPMAWSAEYLTSEQHDELVSLYSDKQATVSEQPSE